MSKRRDIALRLALEIADLRMAVCRGGGKITKARDERSYDIMFTKPGRLEGLVRVYSPRFILILAAGEDAPPVVGWRAVYDNEEHASQLLQAVAKGDGEAALKIPTKPERAKA